MCPAEFVTWREYHSLVAEVVGAPAGHADRFVGVPFEDLVAIDPQRFKGSSYFNNYFCSEKLRADVPFAPRVALREGIARVIASLDAAGAVTGSDTTWEDEIIAAQRCVRQQYAPKL
jgi:nucleoside-diphosphate-sugar epimerase